MEKLHSRDRTQPGQASASSDRPGLRSCRLEFSLVRYQRCLASFSPSCSSLEKLPAVLAGLSQLAQQRFKENTKSDLPSRRTPSCNENPDILSSTCPRWAAQGPRCAAHGPRWSAHGPRWAVHSPRLATHCGQPTVHDGQPMAHGRQSTVHGRRHTVGISDRTWSPKHKNQQWSPNSRLCSM